MTDHLTFTELAVAAEDARQRFHKLRVAAYYAAAIRRPELAKAAEHIAGLRIVLEALDEAMEAQKAWETSSEALSARARDIDATVAEDRHLEAMDDLRAEARL